MFQRLGGRAENLTHLDRIEAAVRARFGLAPDDIVLVAEEAGFVPGYPPLLVTVRFWRAAARHRLRIFKPAADIDACDLPPRWLLPTLIDDGDPDCC